MSYFTILECDQDIAGKYRVRVDLIGESVFFKYDHEPTPEEVDDETIAFLTNRENADRGAAEQG